MIIILIVIVWYVIYNNIQGTHNIEKKLLGLSDNCKEIWNNLILDVISGLVSMTDIMITIEYSEIQNKRNDERIQRDNNKQNTENIYESIKIFRK